MKSIVLIVDYFGSWPGWFDVFLASCGSNPTVDWHITTDCPIPSNPPQNMTFNQMSFREYCLMVSDKLGIYFSPDRAYNVVNLRPMYGTIHESIISRYDYFGWCDVDVIFGDIRSFYDEKVLSHNVISTHRDICSGHFFLLRNAEYLRNAYKYIPNWRRRLELPGACDWKDSLDEALLTALFCPVDSTRELFARKNGFAQVPPDLYEKNYFVEQWSTPFTPNNWVDGGSAHPDVWYLANSSLRNGNDGERTFLYLHLMNFKAKRWVNEDLYGNAPTWDQLRSCILFDLNVYFGLQPERRNLRIDRQGIHLI